MYKSKKINKDKNINYDSKYKTLLMNMYFHITHLCIHFVLIHSLLSPALKRVVVPAVRSAHFSYRPRSSPESYPLPCTLVFRHLSSLFSPLRPYALSDRFSTNLPPRHRTRSKSPRPVPSRFLSHRFNPSTVPPTESIPLSTPLSRHRPDSMISIQATFFLHPRVLKRHYGGGTAA